MVENGEKIKTGKVLVKIPRRSSKSEILQEVYQITDCLKLVTLQTYCSFKKSMVLFLLEKLKLLTG
jgi:hypothetical protein